MIRLRDRFFQGFLGALGGVCLGIILISAPYARAQEDNEFGDLSELPAELPEQSNGSGPSTESSIEDPRLDETAAAPTPETPTVDPIELPEPQTASGAEALESPPNESLSDLDEAIEPEEPLAASALTQPDAPMDVPVDGASDATTLSAEYDPRIPRYQQMNTGWSFDLTFSPNSLGGKDIVPEMGGAKTRGVLLNAEYLFPNFQKLGVFSIGPTLGIYSVATDSPIVSNRYSLWTVGGKIRYQLRFLREQWVVPTAAFHFEYFRYSFLTSGTGGTFLTGPSFGLWVLLNPFDPDSSAQFYSEHSIKRSYLTAEYKVLSGSQNALTVSGASYFFGLRLEW